MIRKGPCFTEAARAAAAARRKEKAGLAALAFAVPNVFVLRAEGPDLGFRWEIRRFGGVTLASGRAVFATGAEARAAGCAALATLLAGEDAVQRCKPSAIERAPKAMNMTPEARRSHLS